MYTTYRIESWHWYQRVHPSTEHTIECYNKRCDEIGKQTPQYIMVLRENVTKINGFYFYGNGFPCQNCAETDGYVDVRTGKKYKNSEDFCKDIR